MDKSLTIWAEAEQKKKARTSQQGVSAGSWECNPLKAGFVETDLVDIIAMLSKKVRFELFAPQKNVENLLRFSVHFPDYSWFMPNSTR